MREQGRSFHAAVGKGYDGLLIKTSDIDVVLLLIYFMKDMVAIGWMISKCCPTYTLYGGGGGAHYI